MFKQILVPVDLTDRNSKAINVAADLASGPHGKVTLLHVIEMLDAPYDELQQFYEGLERRAHRELDTLAAPLHDAGIEFEERVCYGKRAPEIVSYASEHEVDLIVIGSHRLTPDNLTKGLLTISHQVAIAADKPVLIVK